MNTIMKDLTPMCRCNGVCIQARGQGRPWPDGSYVRCHLSLTIMHTCAQI